MWIQNLFSKKKYESLKLIQEKLNLSRPIIPEKGETIKK